MQGSRFVVGAALLLALLLPSSALAARHVYVSNSASASNANISGFTLAPNGVLQANGAAAGSGDAKAEGLVFASDGGHLYAAGDNVPATVSTLAVAADGTLTSGTTVPAGSNGSNFLAMAPDGG